MSIKRTLGAAVMDMPRSVITMRGPDGWIGLRNRVDSMELSKEPRGVRINAPYSSTLHVCDVFPWFARNVLQKALRKWTFQLPEEFEFSEKPDISFVIPHRGKARQSLLDLTIRSIAATDEKVECIVVEQDDVRNLESLPANTRHVLARHPVENRNWHKSFALNQGVKRARGDIIVLHDGDILVPRQYPSQILAHLRERRFDAAYLQRFLFYLTTTATERLVDGQPFMNVIQVPPESVKQNWVGGTVAITRDAFDQIGGFDESFKNWSGEDREFHDRCLLLKTWFHGYVPFLHLWHAPQREKVNQVLKSKQEHFTQSQLNASRAARANNLRLQNFCKDAIW